MLLIAPNVAVDRRLEIYRLLSIEGARDPAVSRLAARVADDARTTKEPLAAVALRAIHRFAQYRPDPPGPDVVFTPGETLTRGGDCEDLSILLGAVLRAVGVPFRIVWLDRSETGYPQSHVTLECQDEDGLWKYAEASIPGARLGEEPLRAADRSLAMQRRLGK